MSNCPSVWKLLVPSDGALGRQPDVVDRLALAEAHPRAELVGDARVEESGRDVPDAAALRGAVRHAGGLSARVHRVGDDRHGRRTGPVVARHPSVETVLEVGAECARVTRIDRAAVVLGGHQDVVDEIAVGGAGLVAGPDVHLQGRGIAVGRRRELAGHLGPGVGGHRGVADPGVGGLHDEAHSRRSRRAGRRASPASRRCTSCRARRSRSGTGCRRSPRRVR